MAPKAPAIAVFVATMANCTSVAANVEAALKPNQPNSRMNVPSMAIGMWWPGMRAGLAVLGRTCRCGGRARWRRRARRRRRRRAPRRSRRSRRSRRRGSSCPRSWRASRRPRSTPRTAGSRCAPQKRPQIDEAAPLPALGHRPGRDRGRGVHEGHHVEEEAEQRRRDAVAATAPSRPATGTPSCREPIRRLADRRRRGRSSRSS